MDDALTTLGESKQTRKETTSGVKRKATDEDIVEDQDEDDVVDVAEAPTTSNSHQAYNTRFKGVKRVKLGREIPEGFPYTPHRRAPRKSAPANLGSGSRTKTTDKNGAGGGTLKRPRGRPRKNPQLVSTHSPKARWPPTSKMKQVFDGVVVVKRAHPPNKKAELEDTAASHPDPDADAEGEMDGDSEEMVVPDHVELNGLNGVAGENEEVVVPDHVELNGLIGVVGENDSEEVVVPDHVELNGVAGENNGFDSSQGDPSVPQNMFST